MHRHRRLPRQTVEQPPLGARVATGACAHAQLADPLPAYANGTRSASSSGRPAATLVVPQPQGNGCPQRPRHRCDQLRQDLVGDSGRVCCRLQALADAGQGRVGVLHVAVHEPVDGSLQPAVQRLRDDRDECGREERRTGAPAEQATEQSHHRDVRATTTAVSAA